MKIFKQTVAIVALAMAMAFAYTAYTEYTAKHPGSAKVVDVWVMSQCPYGLRALNKLYSLEASGDAKWDSLSVRFVVSSDDGNVTSLHGPGEVYENIWLREFIEDVSPTDVANWAGWRLNNLKVPFPAITRFITHEGQMNVGVTDDQYKNFVEGVAYPLGYGELLKDADKADHFGITASPTLVVDGRKMSLQEFLVKYYPAAEVEEVPRESCN